MSRAFLNSENAVRTVAKIRKTLDRGLITPDEYFSTFLLMIAHSSESAWTECLATVPPDQRSELLSYARAELIPVDFMPQPAVVDYNDTQTVELVKQQMRPRFIALLQLIEQMTLRSTEAEARE